MDSTVLKLTVLSNTRFGAEFAFIAMRITPDFFNWKIWDVENWGLQICLSCGMMGVRNWRLVSRGPWHPTPPRQFFLKRDTGKEHRP